MHARLKNTAYQCALFFSYSTYYSVTYLTDFFTSHLLLSTPPTPHESMGCCFGRRAREGLGGESALWVCEVGINEREMESGETSPADFCCAFSFSKD